jgi:hypothetical protein
MYAVVTKVSVALGRIDDAVGEVHAQVLPMLKSQAGHVVSYFSRNADGTNGMSISVFETKDQAVPAAATVGAPPESAVSVETIEVREVIASG